MTVILVQLLSASFIPGTALSVSLDTTSSHPHVSLRRWYGSILQMRKLATSPKKCYPRQALLPLEARGITQVKRKERG